MGSGLTRVLSKWDFSGRLRKDGRGGKAGLVSLVPLLNAQISTLDMSSCFMADEDVMRVCDSFVAVARNEPGLDEPIEAIARVNGCALRVVSFDNNNLTSISACALVQRLTDAYPSLCEITLLRNDLPKETCDELANISLARKVRLPD